MKKLSFLLLVATALIITSCNTSAPEGEKVASDSTAVDSATVAPVVTPAVVDSVKADSTAK